MPKKLTQEQVVEIFAGKGCELLDKYEGNQISMSYKCKCGNITKTSLIGFRNSDGCRQCSGPNIDRKYTYEYVKNYFAKEGCELLEEVYTKSVLPLRYKCKCGTISHMDFGNFLRGRRCQTCKGIFNSEKFRTKDDDIRQVCEENGCKFLRSFIKNGRIRIEYKCKCDNVAEAYLSNYKRFPNCKKCGSAKISGDKCHMYDPDREAVALRKKFRKICGQHIKRYMEATGNKKTRHTHELLGYTPKRLQEHILNHPDYEKCKDNYHVDHIFPLKAFMDYGIFDLKLINRLDNLRPMPGNENLLKSDYYDINEFEVWLNEKAGIL